MLTKEVEVEVEKKTPVEVSDILSVLLPAVDSGITVLLMS